MSGKNRRRSMQLGDLKSGLAAAQAQLRDFKPSDLPPLALFEIKDSRADFGARRTVIEEQLKRLQMNIERLGDMSMDADASKSIVRFEDEIFEYATNVLPEDWKKERDAFMLEVVRLMIKYYPPYVWKDLDDEMKKWVLGCLDIEKFDPSDPEMLQRVQCVDVAYLSVPRIAKMGVRLGVFKNASPKDLPQQKIVTKVPVEADDGSGRVRHVRMELVCHFPGSAGLTQPLRHKIDLLNALNRDAFKEELHAIKEGVTLRYVDALAKRQKDPIFTWFHLQERRVTKSDPETGEDVDITYPGGYVRVKIEDGWVLPVSAAGRLVRTRGWQFLVNDLNDVAISADSIGQKKFVSRAQGHLDDDTFRNIRYWHTILNNAYAFAKSMTSTDADADAPLSE